MKQSSVLHIAALGLLAFYPFIVYFGLSVLPASFFGLLLLVAILIRLAAIKRAERLIAIPALSLLMGYALAASVLGREQPLLFYPVIVNLVLSIVFAASLRSEEPLLLRVVRHRGMQLSEHGPRYLARLTAVWAVFFAVNALIALWTTTASIEIWTLYNGLIAYLLVALLVGVEWLYRCHYRRRLGVSGH